MAHVETVSEIYAAFGRGDVPAILERVSDDVRWEHWADWFPHRDGKELHVWHFDSEGKVDHFRHYVDTAKHMAAARGEATLG